MIRMLRANILETFSVSVRVFLFAHAQTEVRDLVASINRTRELKAGAHHTASQSPLCCSIHNVVSLRPLTWSISLARTIASP